MWYLGAWMKKLIFCGIFFLTIDLFSVGFMVHTLVKTPTGLVPIEMLKEGDIVCADGFDEQYYSKPVLFANIYQTTVIAKVIIADEVIFTTPDQCFLNDANEWIPVANLEAGVKVKSTSGYLAVESVEFFYQPIESYSVSVADLGNFYVSKREILAHNFVAVVVFGGAIAKGLGFIIFEKIVEYGTYTAAVATAGYLASRYQRSQQQPKAPENKPSVKKPTTTGGGNGMPPDDPNDPRRNYGGYKLPKNLGDYDQSEFRIKKVYDGAPYHHKVGNAIKSAAPIDGQAALDKSYVISETGTSPRRIAVSDGQIVVLHRTQVMSEPGGQTEVFHGHVRDWAELDPDMQTALRRNGLVTKSGKIIK